MFDVSNTQHKTTDCVYKMHRYMFHPVSRCTNYTSGCYCNIQAVNTAALYFLAVDR